jgi:hypothetical protein
MNTSTRFLVRLALAATLPSVFALPAFAQGVGDITCDTPDLVGTVLVVAGSPDPADDIALVKVQEDVVLPVDKGGGGYGELSECVVGPLPMQQVQVVGGGAPAYVEHGLAQIAKWQGFVFDVDLSDDGAPIDVAVVAIDFDRGEALAEQYVLRVERSQGGAAALAVLRGDAGLSEVARLPLTTGRQSVTIGWPTATNPGIGLVVGTGSQTSALALAAGSRPIAVRVGYLGLNGQPQSGDGQVALIAPAFVAD